MKKITIRPLLKLLITPNPDLSWGEFQQLKDKLQHQQQQKAAQGQGATAEELYLLILSSRDFFKGRRKLPRQELLSEIDKIIVKGHYAYTTQIHSARHPNNSFYHHKNKGQRRKKIYDLAFYNHLAGDAHRAHHSYNQLKSIFYMRCEEVDDRILFGNMQIDDRGQGKWSSETLASELRRPKNIYGTMIQQALKHALSIGKNEILFQGGDACEIAQWNKTKFYMIKVTEKNYAKINKIYSREEARFGTTPGLIFPSVSENHYPEVLVKSTRNSYTVQVIRNEPPSILFEIWYLRMAKAHVMRGSYPRRAADVVWEGTIACGQKMSANAPAQEIHARLEKLITDLTGVVPSTETNAAQIADLAALQEQEAENLDKMGCKTFMRIIENYLVRWGYDKILLQYFRSLRRVDLRGPRPKGYGEYVYYSIYKRSNRNSVSRKNLKRPEIGRSYLVLRENKYDINFQISPRELSRGRIHSWYETTIPAELKKYGLGCEKVKIRTKNGKKQLTAHAWKVISGIEEFTQRPLVIF